MAKRLEPKMPNDWTDVAGWDAYYRSRIAALSIDEMVCGTGTIGLDEAPAFVAEVKAKGWRSVWVPGCGMSPLACILAHLGLEVVATDVSAAAIEFQKTAATRFARWTEPLGQPDPAGTLECLVHDFRSPFRTETFDLIMNVKAFQAFPVKDMVAIALGHAVALRPGRYAWIDTMNVQGVRRDRLERALEKGGFVVPLSALNRWYRKSLRQTGIPHVFVLGRPVIPRIDAYADDETRWEADMARLSEVVDEYRKRLDTESEAEWSRIGPTTKVAHVIYSTG